MLHIHFYGAPGWACRKHKTIMISKRFSDEPSAPGKRIERTWDVIRRYETQSVMKVGLNQLIMREVLGKLMSSAESDVLIE